MYLSGMLDPADRATPEAWAEYSLSTISPLLNSADWSVTVNNPNAPALARYVIQRMMAGASDLDAAIEYFTRVHPELYPGPMNAGLNTGAPKSTPLDTPITVYRGTTPIVIKTDAEQRALETEWRSGTITPVPVTPLPTIQPSPGGGGSVAPNPNSPVTYVSPVAGQPEPSPLSGSGMTWILLGLVGLALLRK